MTNPFVEHLKRKGFLTADQADRVAIWASARHDPVGIIAVEHGLILGRQIDEVLGHQKDCDWRFGQVAVEMGHLTKGTLNALLQIQRVREWARVAEAVILAGILPSEQVFRAFGEFISEHVSVDAAGLAAAA